MKITRPGGWLLLLVLAVAVLMLSCVAPGQRVTTAPGDETMPASTTSKPSPLPSVSPATGPEPGSLPETGGTGETADVYDGPVELIAWPADPEHIAHIYPNGGMIGAHVTPIDHQYYYWSDPEAALEDYPVYSPADGYVIDVQYLRDDYIVFIEHSASVQTEFIHLEKLVGPLAELEGRVTFQNSARVCGGRCCFSLSMTGA